jgi:hypothetical protein
MKTFRSLIVIALLAAQMSGSVIAQIPVLGTDEILEKLRLNREVEGNYNILYKDVQGDPYIFKDFHEGTMCVLPDRKFTVNIRYDIYADQMHLKDKDQIYAIIHPDKVTLIEAGSYKFIYSAYMKSPEDKDQELSSYFILKTDGKCKLLIKKHIRVQDAETNKLYQEAKPPKFIATSDTYFLKIDNLGAVRIKNKKDLLTVLADKSDAVDKYISSNKLDAKEISDLEKIVTYYNSL